MRAMKFSELMRRAGGGGGEGGGGHPGGWGGGTEVTGGAEECRKGEKGGGVVARAGTKTNGEKYIYEAMERGAVATVLPADCGVSEPKGYHRNALARVEDVNLACAILAHEVAGNPTAGLKMIGVTGTKGKTTVA